MIVPAHVWGKNAPSNILRLGCIGTGRMGRDNMKECLDRGLKSSGRAHLVAVCDLDGRRANLAKEMIEQTYARQPADFAAPKVDVYEDYHDLLARDDLDGVIIATPDHWHALVAIAAAEARKDIYLQKPLTNTLVEGRKLVTAVRRHQVILQVGSQQRSDANFRRACELVRNGRVGKLDTIEVRLPPDHGTGDGTPTPHPQHLNYDCWLGPTPPAPYARDRVHPDDSFLRPGWLQIEPYSRGMITGWGSHMFDIAQWGHGSDDTCLVEIEASAEFPERGLFNVHTNFQSEGRYADGVRVIGKTGEPAGVRFSGDQGWLDVGRSHFKADPITLLNEPLANDALRLPVSKDHMLNFLDAIRTRQDPICPVEVGHRSNTICIITHIAMKLGRKLRFSPESEQFIDDPSANELLDYAHRKPWTV